MRLARLYLCGTLACVCVILSWAAWIAVILSPSEGSARKLIGLAGFMLILHVLALLLSVRQVCLTFGESSFGLWTLAVSAISFFLGWLTIMLRALLFLAPNGPPQ